MDDFLVKPYDEMQIADMLGRWLTPITGVSTAPSDNSAPDNSQPSPSFHAPKLDMVAVEESDEFRMTMVPRCSARWCRSLPPFPALSSRRCEAKAATPTRTRSGARRTA